MVPELIFFYQILWSLVFFFCYNYIFSDGNISARYMCRFHVSYVTKVTFFTKYFQT